MTMTSSIRKFALTAHVTFSIGWLGAVTVFLTLAIAGLTTTDNQVARSSYLAMELTTWFVILPFSLASFSSGLIQALGTKWGLFKYYWIVVKLFLSIAMTFLLILHLQPISYLAGVVADNSSSYAKESILLIDLITKSGGAILILVVITAISIYKPWGKTGFGSTNKFRLNENFNMKKSKTNTNWGRYVLYGLLAILLIFILMHLFGGGMGQH